MKTVFKNMDKDVNGLFETIAKATRPETTLARIKKEEDKLKLHKMETKTLLDKLTPEAKAILVKSKDKFPTLFNSMMKALVRKEFVIQLTIDEANQLTTFLDNGRSFDSIYELFITKK